MPNLAYLSLGSNVGDRENQLRDAIARLGNAEQILSVSSFYETEPVEVTDQPWFLNCAIALETSETPQSLLATLLRIEREMGRHRTREKGPRIIDLDILLFKDLSFEDLFFKEQSGDAASSGLFGDTILNTGKLTIPHPAMQERRFVLEPLAEIAPEAWHPVLKKTVRELLAALPPGQVVRKI
jgi:2-amino-4-hydroxy-6-hydroxymethyldihydropteridine diphosphokinase